MALEGTLQDMSLSDLFQVFRLGPKSGVLLLQKADDRGIIYVDRGTLIDAFIVRGAERTVIATADEAVLQTLAWDDARFVFRHDLSVADRPVQMKHDSDWLVMESLRRSKDPMGTMPYQNITLDTQLQLSPLPTNAESSVSLDVDQWRILSHAANNQDLRTICKATSIDPDKALRIVAELMAIGLVEVARQKDPQKAPAKPASQPDNQPAPATAVPVATTDAESPDSTKRANGIKESQPAPLFGRGLLNAIMRRISEL
jgi:hypothetical protein